MINAGKQNCARVSHVGQVHPVTPRIRQPSANPSAPILAPWKVLAS